MESTHISESVVRIAVAIGTGVALLVLYSEFLKRLEKQNEEHVKRMNDMILDMYPKAKETKE